MRPIDQQTVLITGATDGLGRALAARLVTDPALDDISGRFYNGLKEARADAQAYDPDARARLRDLSEQLTSP
ncbi:hypothetical protein [Actinomadura livida]|uniref:NAD(P)-dependent dehydrogenase (Short-subunit alcohol dehydrogenase family) n=1 Tax=Actinomadura livida TaxID=79909 RepID=A0A7W7IKR8_9ACTN|nr:MULTISPECIES: hypothetical protein [Actinomadura]MBB4778919.1 NAD(P)-dependent dehydrogenase (short-subunit alcohol dehydrogenase family) [Actinomadura catellatispora]GGU26701.1 hypothetical protein GCM10010208_59410 [Actinomadura livida]